MCRWCVGWSVAGIPVSVTQSEVMDRLRYLVALIGIRVEEFPKTGTKVPENGNLTHPKNLFSHSPEKSGQWHLPEKSGQWVTTIFL